MNFNIVLFEPEIPQNTGNIARTCVLTNSKLHLIEPLGFSLEEKQLKRAGLDYWKDLDLEIHKSFEEFEEKYSNGNFYLSTTKGNKYHTDIEFKYNDFIIFGRESSGLPPSIRDKYSKNAFRIPMINTSTRSLNLSNAVSIIVYEGLRQIGYIDMK